MFNVYLFSIEYAKIEAFCKCNSNKSTGYNRPDHDQQHCYHHAPTVKPETATAVELLMMGVRAPETW
jgi:hypothetical protein